MARGMTKGILLVVAFLILTWCPVQAQDLGEKAGFTEHDTTTAAASFSAPSPSPGNNNAYAMLAEDDLGDKAGFIEHNTIAASYSAPSPGPGHGGAYSTAPPVMMLATALMLCFLQLIILA